MIFYDMDGVLVDHMAAVCEYTGKPMNELITPGQWEVPGVNFPSLPMTLWAFMFKTPECDCLLNEPDPDKYLLTTICSEECYAGKLEWVKMNIPHMQNRIITTEYKHLLAAPGRILYDDRDEHIVAWEKAGGIGRLVPRLWNSGHEMLPK